MRIKNTTTHEIDRDTENRLEEIQKKLSLVSTDDALRFAVFALIDKLLKEDKPCASGK